MKVERILAADDACPVARTLAITDAACDSTLRARWQELAAHAAEPNAFAEAWFVTASLPLPQMRGARLLVVEAGDMLIGTILVHVAPAYGRVPIRNVQNLLHYHSLLGTPLVRGGWEPAFWGAILDLLDRAEWARGLLHVAMLTEDGAVHHGLRTAAAARGRPCAIVHRSERALLASDLGSVAYYEATIRKKKRKELKRLADRLSELGRVEHRRLGADDDLAAWTDAFLALEASGWKGRGGSALLRHADTERFFRSALAGAQAAGRLDLRRIDLDGAPIAMLVHFLTPPGGFSFKIAYDEAYARFSPGILVQLDALDLLDRADLAWVDSCAVENHPMINSLWPARRALVRVSVPLRGRRGLFALARAPERIAAAWRARRPTPHPDPADDA